MLFLGQAANYRAKDILRHTFAIGTSSDSDALRQHLALRYRAHFDQTALFCTGRSAIAYALKTLAPKNSKVLINGFTCHAVLEAVKKTGNIPIFADINPDFLHYDVKELKKQFKIHPDLKVIIVQNTLGIPIDIKPIEQFAKKHQIIIIEDLAHCAGVLYPDGREVGTVGDATALSFGKGKSVDTISGGALILRNNAKIKQPTLRPAFSDSFRARFYPFFGACMRGARHLHIHKFVTGFLLKIHWIERSADAKLDTKTRLSHWQAKLALRQFMALKNRPLRQHFLVQNRDILLQKLEQRGFYFGEIWYDTPISPVRYYNKAHFPEKDCPNSVRVAAEIINLPMYYSDEQLKPALKIIEEHNNGRTN